MDFTDFVNHVKQKHHEAATVIRLVPLTSARGRPSTSELTEHYVRQWDELVTAHHGEVQMRATVFIDGQFHRHEGYIVANAFGRHRECHECYSANKREMHRVTSKSKDLPAMWRYELEIVRRASPRVLIDVPFPAPRNRNPRIEKKWAKRAAGLTAKGYQTETIRVSLTKLALNVIRKELSERDARARHRK